jgi:hypothetical protein
MGARYLRPGTSDSRLGEPIAGRRATLAEQSVIDADELLACRRAPIACPLAGPHQARVGGQH